MSLPVLSAAASAQFDAANRCRFSSSRARAMGGMTPIAGAVPSRASRTGSTAGGRSALWRNVDRTWCAPLRSHSDPESVSSACSSGSRASPPIQVSASAAIQRTLPSGSSRAATSAPAEAGSCSSESAFAASHRVAGTEPVSAPVRAGRAACPAATSASRAFQGGIMEPPPSASTNRGISSGRGDRVTMGYSSRGRTKTAGVGGRSSPVRRAVWLWPLLSPV